MESLDVNVRREILINLQPVDIVKYCSANKKTNSEICSSNTFWRRKLEKDYPLEMKGIGVIQNPKNIYMSRFTSAAYKIEDFISEIINYHFGRDYQDYLSIQYKENLFKAIYTAYETIKNTDFSTPEFLNKGDDILGFMQDLMVDATAEYYPSPDGYDTTYEQGREFFDHILPNFITEIMKEKVSDFL